MEGRRLSLMIMVLIFQVLSASLHGCLAAFVEGQPPSKRNTVRPGSVFRPLSGDVYPNGNYSVTLSIGNPAKPFEFEIDTGSDLTWVQCDAPCSGCTLPRDRLYKPVKGNSVACNDPICAALQSPEAHQCKNPNDECGFELEYADGVSVHGVLVSDNFSLDLVKCPTVYPLLAFGCGSRLQNRGPDPPPPGVLGLGKSKASISSQLSGMGVTQNVIGHCLSGQGGFLVLGGDFIPKSGMTWTPMLQNSFDKKYSSGPAELLFRGKPTGVKGLNVIFDTGSTFTYLSSEVYQTVANLIKNNLGKQLQEVKDNYKDVSICWKGSTPFKSVRDVKEYFSTFALSFTSNIQFPLPPEAYLIVTERGNVCLGILNGNEAGLGNINLIGDISLQYKLMMYDNEKQRIGWRDVKNCPRLFQVL